MSVQNYVFEVQDHLKFLGYYQMVNDSNRKELGAFAQDQMMRGYHDLKLPRETATAIYEKAISMGTIQ
jgi:hypothetical protein